MEGIEKPKSFLEKVQEKIAYIKARREAYRMDNEYEQEKKRADGLFENFLEICAFGHGADSNLEYSDAVEEFKDGIEELRTFEQEKLGMKEDSDYLKGLVSDFTLVEKGK